MNSENNLRINHPCPYLVNRLVKDGDNLHCRSCKKNIVDFRGMDFEEIKCKVTPDTCGIFTIDQLKGQRKMTFWGKVVFYTLMVCSFLGFNVKPAKAHYISNQRPLISINDSGKLKKAPRSVRREMKKNRKYKITRRGKKKTFRMGCPDF